MKEHKDNIYFDNNASTPISQETLAVVTHTLKTMYGNPSSITKEGRTAKNQLILARKKIASFLKCSPNEITFTSGGTESIHSLINGICSGKKNPIITTAIEHKAVLHSVRNTGLEVQYLSVDVSCNPSISELLDLVNKGASAIVLSLVNGETGSILPLQEIAKIAHQFNVPLILDGVAALGKMEIPLYPGITGVAFSGHKCHGPKGSGFFYLAAKCPFTPIFKGGSQENSKRAGTENVAGILGLSKAVEEISIHRYSKLKALKERFEEQVKAIFPNSSINGGDNRVSNVSNIFFKDIDGDHLLIYLDQNGITASLGSACSSGALEPSHVLLGIGCSQNHARSSLRFSFNWMNTFEEIDRACYMIEKYKQEVTRNLF